MPRDCPGCTAAYFDVFALVANPSDFYWNLVEGGGGRVSDPVDAAGALPAEGATWFWGGQIPTGVRLGEGPQVFNRPSGLLAETEGRPVYLSLCLDTATRPDRDDDYASWGWIEQLRVVPKLADGTLLDPMLPDWVISPEDPDGGTEWTHTGGGTTVSLGPVSPPDGPDAQPPGIWGIGAVLPATHPVTGDAVAAYQVTMLPDLATWDLYDTVAAPVRAPELGVAALVTLSVALTAVGSRFLHRRLR